MTTLRASGLVLLFVLSCLASACAAPLEDDAASTGAALSERVLDPSRSYDDRLALLDLLSKRHPAPPSWPDARRGIYIQTEWQRDSGRATKVNGRLSGWWPNINYTLTAWQMLVLQQRRGEFADIRIVGYEDAHLAIPENVAQSVLSFYDALDAARARASAPAHERIELEMTLQTKMWTMHQAALAVGLERFDGLRSSLPAGERDFAGSWAGLVDLLTAANFPTEEYLIQRINELVLPQHLVEPDDYNVLRRTDLPVIARTGVVAVRLLAEFERRTGGLLGKLLRKMARTAQGAHDAAHYLVEALRHGSDNPVTFLRDATFGWVDTSEHAH